MRYLILTFSVFFLLESPIHCAQNLTQEFLNKLHDTVNSHPKDMEQFNAFIEDLKKNYKILFVPGWLSDAGEIVGEQNFGEQAKWLHGKLGFRNGENYEIVKINSYASIAFNEAIIANAIKDSFLPVLLIGHSKGGVDIFQALVNEPDLQNKVKGIITFQAPFYGSTAIDYALNHFLMKNFMKLDLMLSGGSFQSLKDLTTKVRVEFVKNNKQKLEEIERKIPVITLVGWMEDNELSREIVQEMIQGNRPVMNDEDERIFPSQSMLIRQTRGRFFSCIIRKMAPSLQAEGQPLNDFMIPKDSQRLLDADYVEVPGIDHISLVMSSYYNSVDKIRTTIYLLQMLLEKTKY